MSSLGNKANDNRDNISKLESIKNRFSKTAKEELSDEIASDDKAASIFLIVVNALFSLCLIMHQTDGISFLVPKFETLDMIMLYGIPIYWITTSVLILIDQKHPSRDLDSYGGLFFATFAIGWLIVVFPFDFANFAKVFRISSDFLVQWISNEIALVLLILLFIVHLIFAVYSLILRLYVRKARKQS